jgi:hypothetical protein
MQFSGCFDWRWNRFPPGVRLRLPFNLIHQFRSLHDDEQEARADSALNHPNIITIHEISEHQGEHYLVTEFIAGETLRQRLSGEALSPEAAWCRCRNTGSRWKRSQPVRWRRTRLIQRGVRWSERGQLKKPYPSIQRLFYVER